MGLGEQCCEEQGSTENRGQGSQEADVDRARLREERVQAIVQVLERCFFEKGCQWFEAE